MSRPDPRFESPVDRSIREATERGDFDDLPGKGKPLPGAGTVGPVDENWWVRGYVRREGLSSEALLPPSVQLRKELDRIDETCARFVDERRVREHVAEVNSRVVDHMRFPSGPRVPIRKLDADEIVERWRAARAPRPAPRPEPVPEPAPRRGWRSRLRRS
ncbi:DnaJ family domain-containing protein [Pseudonocardia phyllosphaerae]|uniref:DnaJ family domain-containing protein n=1 Tax=Pseudonocardia phyllosphaerae TaxID=3390502 RepID=UPI00397C0639